MTPMMAQYPEIKAAHPDCLLFYRMGDFYELFFDDAEIASRALGIVLTKRGKHLGDDIPMCGVPVERSDEYLHRLIAHGHRVAVCEQIEDPAEARKRGGKSVVRRDVVRLVTPGTLTEETLLDAARNNFLAGGGARRAPPARTAASASRWIDISTGEFRIAECDRLGLAAEIARLEPSEIVVPDALYADQDLAPFWRELRRRHAGAARRLRRRHRRAPPRGVFRGRDAATASAPSRGSSSTAAAACVTYVERTQIGKRPPLAPPSREAAAARRSRSTPPPAPISS